MKARFLALLAVGAALAAPAFAQSDGACIVAGRLSEGRWAPRLGALQLRDAAGRVVARSDRASLERVRSAELARPALLSRCNGEQALAIGDNEPAGRKTEVPALSRGRVDVDAVHFLKLRTGGELVELRVRYPGERVVMLTR